MDFELTQERQMLQDTLRRFLADRYDVSVRNDILKSARGQSVQIWQELADLGVMGALVGEDMGGFGGKGFDIAVVFEEMGRAGVVEPLLDCGVLAGGLIAALGNESQRALLEDMIGGAVQLAFAHSEVSGRYDPHFVHCTAGTSADGVVLNGRKAVVINAEAADHIVVSAREPEGISLFLVPRDTAGSEIQGYPLLAGARAAEVVLDGVILPQTARLGGAGAAQPAIDQAIAAATVAICAETLGAMETATKLTREYLVTRKQFGRPIGTFQALAHRMSDMLIELEQARSAVINAAGHLESDARTRDLHMSAAKNLLGRAGRLIAEDSIQMHGGIAMTQEYELAHIAKRIIMADHRFGDEDFHMERFIDLSAA